MKLYDPLIEKVNDIIDGYGQRNLPVVSKWKNLQDKSFIFQEDTAVELGATGKDAFYLIAFTSNPQLVQHDEITLIGKDICELIGDVPFARIALIRIDDSALHDDQKTYRALRDIEYKRYKVNPDGYMFRVNTSLMREGARVSKDAVNRGISFADIGSIFLSEYKKKENVQAVKQIFITSDAFDFISLSNLSRLNEGITVALDHILKDLKMDCRTCNFKDICDVVDGMRELHSKSALLSE